MPASQLNPMQDEPGDNDRKETSLDTSVSNLLEETRILLPGTQTLFGFQLIVVFNGSFQSELSSTERALHLVATILTAVAIALLMGPAAYHRQAEPESVSRRFLVVSTRQLDLGTVPLAIAICIELYLVGQVAVGRQWISLAIAVAVGLLFTWLWYILPRRHAADD